MTKSDEAKPTKYCRNDTCPTLFRGGTACRVGALEIFLCKFFCKNFSKKCIFLHFPCGVPKIFLIFGESGGTSCFLRFSMENCLDLAIRTEGAAGSVAPTIEHGIVFGCIVLLTILGLIITYVVICSKEKKEKNK